MSDCRPDNYVFMMRKTALKIQWAEPTGKVKRGEKIKHLPTGQKIIIVPSRASVTDSNNDARLCEKGVILARCTADYIRKSPHVSCWMTRSFFLCLFFACERLVLNPPTLTADCPRLRVNEVRMESR